MNSELEKYYRRRGILSTAFTCQHKSDCKRGCGDSNFTEAKSAFVGEKYGVQIPRLLFLSADPGTAKVAGDSAYDYNLPESRTPDGVRIGEKMRKKESRRLKGTNELARCILSEFGVHSERSPLPFYAHTNTAKCCWNLKGRGEAPKRLYNNCREHLRGEIELLSPDILVTHGKKAQESFGKILDGNAIAKELDDANAKIVTLNGAVIFWLHTPHPSVRDNSFRDQKQYWPKYTKKIKQFIIEKIGSKN